MLTIQDNLQLYMLFIQYNLVKLDKICDYIPIISTLSNLVDLFNKYITFPLIGNSKGVCGHYYTHIKEKNSLRSVILLVPVLGNIMVCVHDWVNPEGASSETSSLI